MTNVVPDIRSSLIGGQVKSPLKTVQGHVVLASIILSIMVVQDVSIMALFRSNTLTYVRNYYLCTCTVTALDTVSS